VIAAVGLAAGLATGFTAARALSTVLYGIPPWDPLAFASAAALLTVAALGAGYLLARRASRVDPASTLAAE
jgi:putative ABC transport system permease protein